MSFHRHSFEDDRFLLGSNGFPRLCSYIVVRKEFVGGFLFNPFLFNEIVLDDLELCILEKCDGMHSCADIVATIIREFGLDTKTAEHCVRKVFQILQENYAIKWSDSCATLGSTLYSPPEVLSNRSPASRMLSAPVSVYWEITRKCNLRCLHCFANAGQALKDELSLEEVKEIIDELAEIKVFKLEISGGEPFVRKDTIRILEYASQYNIAIKLTTNGFLVDTSLIRSLRDTKLFTVQVSVDGLESTHDRFRRQNNSFQRAIRALKAFSDAGYWTIMSSTVTSYNLHEVEHLLDLAVECGAAAFKASPFIPVGRGQTNLDKLAMRHLEMKKLVRTLVQKKNELKGRIDVQIDGFFPWLCKSSASTKGAGGVSGIGCSAGVSRVAITSTGDVLPCVFLRDWIAGNLRKQSMKEIWETSPYFEIFRDLDRSQLESNCRECEHLGVQCQGGCRASSLAWRGDFFARDPDCWR